MGDYTHLSYKERKQIYTFLSMEWSCDAIAARLNRHRSTIFREIQRNREGTVYWPLRAHTAALRRHDRKPTKLAVNSNSYKYVLSKLKRGWSPEQICGRMQLLKLPNTLCHETIYQYIYKHAKEKLYTYLPRQQRARKAHRQRRSYRHYAGIRSYKNRPLMAETRAMIGHWEGDIIRFAKDRYRSITTLVDRKSRLTHLCKNERSTSRCVMSNIQMKIEETQQTRFTWQSITFDQGSEFSDFAQIERQSGCKVYYATAHSPWLRGTNENTNGRLRRFLPKAAKIKYVTQKMLDQLADQLNNTPRKCLGFLTPYEVFYRSK